MSIVIALLIGFCFLCAVALLVAHLDKMDQAANKAGSDNYFWR